MQPYGYINAQRMSGCVKHSRDHVAERTGDQGPPILQHSRVGTEAEQNILATRLSRRRTLHQPSLSPRLYWKTTSRTGHWWGLCYVLSIILHLQLYLQIIDILPRWQCGILHCQPLKVALSKQRCCDVLGDQAIVVLLSLLLTMT